jgi:hypothetical protein
MGGEKFPTRGTTGDQGSFKTQLASIMAPSPEASPPGLLQSPLAHSHHQKGLFSTHSYSSTHLQCPALGAALTDPPSPSRLKKKNQEEDQGPADTGENLKKTPIFPGVRGPAPPDHFRPSFAFPKPSKGPLSWPVLVPGKPWLGKGWSRLGRTLVSSCPERL